MKAPPQPPSAARREPRPRKRAYCRLAQERPERDGTIAAAMVHEAARRWFASPAPSSDDELLG